MQGTHLRAASGMVARSLTSTNDGNSSLPKPPSGRRWLRRALEEKASVTAENLVLESFASPRVHAQGTNPRAVSGMAARSLTSTNDGNSSLPKPLSGRRSLRQSEAALKRGTLQENASFTAENLVLESFASPRVRTQDPKGSLPQITPEVHYSPHPLPEKSFPETTYMMISEVSQKDPERMRWSVDGRSFFVNTKASGKLKSTLKPYFARK
jgi:hypothetical protein